MNNATFDAENLINTLTEQGRNERRQQELLKQIDKLAQSEMPKRRRLLPWIATAMSVAACLLLIIFTGNRKPQTIANELNIKSDVFDKPRAEGKLAFTLPRRENDCCEETNVFIAKNEIGQQPIIIDSAATKTQTPRHYKKQHEEISHVTDETNEHIEITLTEPIDEEMLIAEAIIPATNSQKEVPDAAPQRRVVETNSLIAYNDTKPDSEIESSTKVVPKSFLGIPYDEHMTNTLFAYNFTSSINKKQ